MDELRDLYQVIFDHNRKPPELFHNSQAPTGTRGFNPACGDQLSVYLKVSDRDVIEDVSFEGRGCAISTASASIDRDAQEAGPCSRPAPCSKIFIGLVTGQDVDAATPAADLGKLHVLTGVRDYPAQLKCATLAWHTVADGTQKRQHHRVNG